MKTKIFTLSFAIVASLGTMFAQYFREGDLYYHILDGKNSEVEVASPSKVTCPIPSSITIPDGALTVGQAREKCAALADKATTGEKFYVHGWVKKLHNKHADYVSMYGSGQFYISEYKTITGDYDSDDFIAYQVYGANGQKLTSVDQVAEGDYVVIYGELTNFGGIYETVGKGAAYIFASTNPKIGNSEEPQPQGDVKDVTIAQAMEIANALDAGGKTIDNYRITATLTKVATSEDKVAEYGNINITVKDETGEIVCYYTNNVGNQKFTAASEVPAIGSVLKIVGPLKLYENKSTGATTPEFENAWIEEIVKQGEGPKDIDGGEVTVAQFLEKEDSDDVWYTLTGTMGEIKDGDQYGNFDLTDETGTVYVYGLTKEQQLNHKNDKSFQSLGLKAGDMIQIRGTKTSYQGKPEVNCAYLLEKLDKKAPKYSNAQRIIMSPNSDSYSNLTTINIPSSVTYNGIIYTVTGIGELAFSSCSGLTSITIPNSVTNIDYGAFRGCSGLTSIDIPNCVTNIGAEAFYGCSSLISIAIPNSVTNIGAGAFYDCSSLISIAIPNSVTNISYGAFEYCSSLKSVEIPNSVTNIENGAFWNCSSLTSITIPNSLTNIGAGAFYGCSSLTSINIPNSVTEIGDRAFYGCSEIETLTLGKSIKSIGSLAFSGCKRITDIYCYAENAPEAVADENGDSFKDVSRKAYLWVPANRVRNYEIDAYWGEFIVKAIEAESSSTDNIVVTPHDNTADVIWPAVNNAETYELTIKDKQGNEICVLVFNAQGQLQSIAFRAPATADAQRSPEHTEATGFRFTIIGLEQGTSYDLSLVAKDASDKTLETYNVSFNTKGGETGIDNLSQAESSPRKILRDGQVYILMPDGRTFSVTGAEVR